MPLLARFACKVAHAFTTATNQVLMQVEGKDGFAVMRKRWASRGLAGIYDGALAFGGGSLMGHYPW